MKKKEGKYNLWAWCNLVAFLINCDNELFKFTDKTFTAESVWHSNSHGELFGVYNCMEMARLTYENAGDILKPTLTKILAGQDIAPSKDFFTLIGLRCIQLLYKTTDEFNEQVDVIWNKTFI